MGNNAIRDQARNLKARSILEFATRTDPRTGLEERYVATSKIRVTAAEIILQDKLAAPFRAVSVDVTADLAGGGVNGLDTGARTPSTWYHLWLIANAKGAVRALLSLSDSKPTAPAGYKFKAYVGGVYNTAENYVAAYFQNGSLVWAEKTSPLPMGSLPDLATPVDLAASVPCTATSAILELSGLTTIGGHCIASLCVGPTANGPWHNHYLMVAGTADGAGLVDHLQGIGQAEVLLDQPQLLYAYAATADDRAEINVLGWRY